ncbi:putative leucine-rich repeat domain-like protein [Tanacetum coccineum]
MFTKKSGLYFAPILRSHRTCAPLPDSNSAAPLILHNADEFYDSSTSLQLVEPTPVVVEADSLAIEGACRGSNSNDFISQMTDDILIRMLSFLPIKNAGATSSLSKRWRFLWCNITRLNFDGSEALEKTDHDPNLFASELENFVKQVNDVIRSHNQPTIEVFQICYNLDKSNCQDVDSWLQFALDKKVEKLHLDLSCKDHGSSDPEENYDFPLPTSDGKMIHLLELPLLNAKVVGLQSLKKVFLKGVNISEPNLLGLLKNSPHLESLSLYESGLFPHIEVSGRDIKMKHFSIVTCNDVESISLYDFDLESFLYNGGVINLSLIDLPVLKVLNICEGSFVSKNDVLAKIAYVASSLQFLCLDLDRLKNSFDVNSIPQLPIVKKLVLLVEAEIDNSLLELTSIAKACPLLEDFSIELLWESPIQRRTEVRHAAPHRHEHLKFFFIGGYFGRISDLELAVYVIDNAVALRKIVIDPICKFNTDCFSEEDCMKKQEAARSSAERELRPRLPKGVDEDRHYRDDLEKTGVPISSDWANVRRLTKFLEHFYQLTLKVSGTLYVTSNSFLDDITSIEAALNNCINGVPDKNLVVMAKMMKCKFHKYYGSLEKCNMATVVASVLDPRNKFEYVEVLLGDVYGKVEGKSMCGMIKASLVELYEDYVRIHAPPETHTLFESSGASSSMNKHRYLNEDVEDESDKFDILNWWKVNSPRFPVLSLLARDVLAIPISTVASKSVFSTDEDWFRENSMGLDVAENYDEIQKIEEVVELVKEGSSVV